AWPPCTRPPNPSPAPAAEADPQISGLLPGYFAAGRSFGSPGPIPLGLAAVQFQLTLAQASAATPDALLAAVVPRAAELAQQFDDAVLPVLVDPAAAAGAAGAAAAAWYPQLSAPAPPPAEALPGAPNAPTILAALIGGRQLLEDGGYRAPSCLIASTAHFLDLVQWVGSNVATEGLLVGANANSLHRATPLNAAANRPHRMIMIGRRLEIAHAAAATASAGEEAVDIAVSVPPSLEVIGDTAAGSVELAVRLRYATRFKDERAVVVFHAPEAG
ncbi:MAG: hypothetical protein ACRDTH_13835, partial [Pseudonocardiaceae bacterium]